MKPFRFSLCAIAVAYVLAGCGAHSGGANALPSVAGDRSQAVREPVQMQPPGASVQVARACDVDLPGDDVRCLAILRTDTPATVDAAGTAVAGYGPADIASAYALPATQSSNQTVAVVDAYNDPSAERDLAVYRAHFHLPACTSASGCFKQVGQSGGALPANNAAWDEEISLDLDMVSATCPTCHILLVEANSATLHNLGRAVDEAVTLGATVVSNSYSGAQVSEFNPHYDHPGVIITAASGDSGSSGVVGVQPCTYPYVVCVGGTYLARSKSNARGWNEVAWASSGSGCPTYPDTSYPAPKPTWQTDSGCPFRSETDVSAVADPATPVAVYNSVRFQNKSGWLEFGGTSVSTPIIAAVYALAGDARSRVGASSLWAHLGTSALNDITAGNNGVGRCLPQWQYICNAGPGYDGPTGVGTPNGLAAF